MMGAWILAVPIPDMAILSADKILWHPRKLIPRGLVGGFSVAVFYHVCLQYPV
jgi:hypothetical protein